jgi:tRNA(Ile)-lysidine synthase
MRNVPKFDAVTRLIELTGPRPRVVVAFSGGVDSTVLAHALGQQRRKLGSLRLVHVDHGLQAPSGEWARHCARVARGLRLPFVTLRLARGRGTRGAVRGARRRNADR